MQLLALVSLFLGLCATVYARPTPEEGAIAVATRETSDATAHKINVYNATPKPIYLWSVSSVAGPMQTIYPYTLWSESQHYDPKTGIALKITKAPDALYNGAGTFIFGYTLNAAEGNIYYSFGKVNQEPFGYEEVSGNNCPGIKTPEMDVTKACKITDLYLRIGGS